LHLAPFGWRFRISSTPGKDVVVTLGSLLKSKPTQVGAHRGARNIGVGVPRKIYSSVLVVRVIGRQDKPDDEINAKQKGRIRAMRMRPWKLILAATYVPTSFPTQYHRPGEA
jgi:hypothetical protein